MANYVCIYVMYQILDICTEMEIFCFGDLFYFYIEGYCILNVKVIKNILKLRELCKTVFRYNSYSIRFQFLRAVHRFLANLSFTESIHTDPLSHNTDRTIHRKCFEEL